MLDLIDPSKQVMNEVPIYIMVLIHRSLKFSSERHALINEASVASAKWT